MKFAKAAVLAADHRILPYVRSGQTLPAALPVRDRLTNWLPREESPARIPVDAFVAVSAAYRGRPGARQQAGRVERVPSAA